QSLYCLIITVCFVVLFCLRATAASEFYTLSLHDALPICYSAPQTDRHSLGNNTRPTGIAQRAPDRPLHYCRWTHHRRSEFPNQEDRKSTRLNSSHVKISYAVFCLKKKKR